MTPRSLALVAVAFALLMMQSAAPSSVSAHLGHVVLRAERYLKVDVEPRGVRLVVSLTLGPAETQRVLEDADVDGDGHVDDAEADAYMDLWGQGLAEELTVSVDGDPVQVLWGEAYLDPPGEVRAVPGAVEMVAHVPLLGGEHLVRILDGMPRDGFDRTDVAFTAQPGATLLASGSGEAAPTDVVEHIGFDRSEDGPTQFVVRVHADGLSLAQRWGIGGGVGAFLALLLLVPLVRSRKRKNAASR